MPTGATRLGWRGEEIARSSLERQGWVLVQKHFRTREGEIDLVMKDGRTLVFVEVKTRRSPKFGLPEESITPKKLERMFAAGERYLQRHPHHGPIRFDLMVLDSSAGEQKVRHHRNIS